MAWNEEEIHGSRNDGYTPPVRMAASFTRAAVSIVFFIVSYQLSLIRLPVICSGVRARQSTRSLAAAISASI